MMRMTISATMLTLTVSCNRSPPPLEHASLDFTTTVEGQEVVLTYEGTHAVMQDEDPDIRLLVLVHHDGRLNSVSSFNYVMAALDSAAADRPELRLRETTMVISPGMIHEWHLIENPERYAEGYYPWWDGGWRGGSYSVTLPSVSNFELIDALILHVADRFQNLRAVVQVGHSAGGQLVSRYAVGTMVHDQLRERGIYMRSIIANPSSFLYLDQQRPNLASDSGFIGYYADVPVVEEESCTAFNQYPYGMDGLAPYMRRRPTTDMLAAFRRRDIWILNGMLDNQVSPDMDPTCPAALQGRHRLERGRRYYEYLGHFFGQDVYDSKFIGLVPGVGHDGRGLYTSDQGKAIIFIDADSAAAALSDVSGLDPGR
ncbi:MAG: hypothetical protein PVJ76_07655 [Gemmatimonadota bacterium]|jgi:hypothetical protein